MSKLSAALLLFITVACNYESVSDTTPEEKKIEESFKKMVEGAERGDVDDYFHFISDDFVYLGDEGNPIVNKDSLRIFLQKFYEKYTFSLPSWETHNIIIKGDLAFRRYSGIAYTRLKSDSSVLKYNRIYLDVLKKNQKGEWKILFHSYTLKNHQ